MTALKTAIPQLASLLGHSVEQMNWRLRGLVAAKALKPRKGRGPGSGVELNGDSVAMVLLAALVTDARSDAVAGAIKFSKACPAGLEKCPFTGARNLRGAIAVGLECGGRWNGEQARLVAIGLDRETGEAVLNWQIGFGEVKRVAFAVPSQPSSDSYSVYAVLKRVDKVIEIITAARQVQDE